MTARTTIDSDALLDDVDHPFRIWAGPGAGKTYWLAGHVVNVLNNSTRLRPPSKIACISYTNVAAELIGKAVAKRLGRPADAMEASTIHAFLYKNVVRPYLHLVKDSTTGECLVAHHLVDGHDEHRPSFKFTESWYKLTGARTPFRHLNWKKVSEYLTNLRWFKNGMIWDLKAKSWDRPAYFPTTHLNSYKFPYWKEGMIDHDDVLYFAHRILDEHKTLLRFLAAKFPYIFLDEFQDTTPCQTDIVRWLSEAGSTVGIIGDPQQSIYGFLNATPEHFSQFSATGLREFEIKGNRRSTDAIIQLLNSARKDGIEQRGIRDVAGTSPVVLVGSVKQCADYFCQLCDPGSKWAILAYKNEKVNELRMLHKQGTYSDIQKELREIDRDREYFLSRIAEGFVLQNQQRFGAAVRCILRAFRFRNGNLRKPWPEIPLTDLERRGTALFILNWLASGSDRLLNLSIKDFYQELRSQLPKQLEKLNITNITRGSFSDLTARHTFSNLVDGLILTEDTRSIRTVHKAKGDEFNDVAVVLDGRKMKLTHLLPKDGMKETEDQRLTYVAVSRAMDRLFLIVDADEIGIDSAASQLNLPVIRQLDGTR